MDRLRDGISENGVALSGTSRRFALYLANEADGLAPCGGFPDAWRASQSSRSFPARTRHYVSSVRSSTGAPLKFPILERASNIQRASLLRPASLKEALDSGSSAQTDALFCPFTLVPTKLTKTPQPT